MTLYWKALAPMKRGLSLDELRATKITEVKVMLRPASALQAVGAKMAERIIDYRQKNGGFKKVEDLMNVSGVGEKSFLKMKPLITVTVAKPVQ